MNVSRRDFVRTSVAGVAGLYALPEAFAQAPSLQNEDGYNLWLRFAPPPAAIANQYRGAIRQVLVGGDSPTTDVICNEMETALASMLDTKIPVVHSTSAEINDGTLVIGTPANSSAIHEISRAADLNSSAFRAVSVGSVLTKIGPEGFIIRNARTRNRSAIAIIAEGERGALYGAYHFLRLLQMGQPIDRLEVFERPRVQLRMLNHWDNANGTIERGYAGNSIWQWADLPDTISPRYADYARANASIGINGAVINNVNADIKFISAEFLPKIAALAEVWRPYGVRLYLSVNFSAPVTAGGMKTADPLDKDVIAWWKAKAEEIYKLIPDFGGFLVKANSEGQPGPKDYGRNHAEGANVMADALAPHGGTVIWRAFIYDEDVDPDRAKRAYIEFTKLDGQFRPNVLIQVKNGPIDFMPREPFHPLFGAMKQTSVMAEIQATQEYLGQAKHLVYLGTMWKEFLDADTYAKGKGSTVGKVLEGGVYPYRVTGIAAVTNPGLNADWCGHHFSQSNWYAAGRLAWDHTRGAAEIAEEWTRMTFTNDMKAVQTIRDMMMGSREAFVNYTMPLGLHHLIGGDHYAPMPQNARAQRNDWTAVYYHQASAEGIGFDRTMKGDKAVGQYFPQVRDIFDSLAKCPEIYLLWFHRCAWDYKLKSGKTLWEGLKEKYRLGAMQAAGFQTTWMGLASQIDPQRHKEVADRLVIQVRDSAAWRDQILQYFQTFSKLPL
jgi:alpha-glucuronidase